MALNDILAKLLIFLGLKESEEGKLKKKIEMLKCSIAKSEDEWRDLQPELKALEMKLKVCLKNFENASPMEKDMKRKELLRAKEEVDRFNKEKIYVLDQRITRDKEVLEATKFLLDDLLDRGKGITPDDIDELAEDKKDVIKGREIEKKNIRKLGNTRQGSLDDEDELADVGADDEALMKDINAMLGKNEVENDSVSNDNQEEVSVNNLNN